MSSSLLDQGQVYAQQGVIDLDEDDEQADEGPPAAPAVTAGTMSEGARAAKALFDAQKWPEAALALYGVVAGETGDDDGNKQLAQYHLAIPLYRLKFYQAAYGIFSELADPPPPLPFPEPLN